VVDAQEVTHVWEVLRSPMSSGYEPSRCGLFASYEGARAEVEVQKLWINSYHGKHYTKAAWSLGLDDEWVNDNHDWIKIRGIKVNP
jgi:hypothetical protein